MLSIVSDLHITDGSTAINVDHSAFIDVLKSEILDNANAKRAKEVRIVLLGDILDLVRTDYWFRNTTTMAERPWGGNLDPTTAMNSNTALIEKQFNAVLDGILETDAGKGLLFMLNNIADSTHSYVKVTYVIGNHDRAFNNFESLRAKLRGRLTSFPADRVEFLNVLDAPEYGVFARHGHEYDVNCHGWQFYNKVLQSKKPIGQFSPEVYKVMAIGEVITCELMAGIVHRVRQKTNNDAAFVREIMDVNNLRPMMDVFVWLEWTSRNLQPAYKKILLDSLKESIQAVLDSELGKLWDKLEPDLIVSGDLTDWLQKILDFIDDKTFDQLKGTVEFAKILENIFRSGKDDFVEGAKREWTIGRDAKYQYVLYGHTHEARQDYFCARADGTVEMYVNTGTYLPLIERTENNQDFAEAHQMTLAHFYRTDEDQNGRQGPGPTMDVWNGMKRKIYQF